MNNNRDTTTKEPGNWDDIKAKLLGKFNWLKETDLRFTEGRKEEMLERVQIILGKTKEELRQIMEKL